MLKSSHTIAKTLIRCLFLLSLLLIPHPSGAEEAVTAQILTGETNITRVMATGSSKIFGNNIAAARTEAISNSLMAAVSKVTVQLLSSEAMILNFQLIDLILLDYTDEVIQNYKVLSTAKTDKRYRVLVEATILMDKVEERLISIGIVLYKHNLPKILLVLSEQNLVDPLPQYWWGEDSAFVTIFSESNLAESMGEKGFSIIDHDLFAHEMIVQDIIHKSELSDMEAIGLGLHFKADVVIVGKAIAQKGGNIMEDNVRSYRAVMKARALRTDSGMEIGSTNQTFITMSANELTGGADALSGVGRLAGAELSKQVASAWQEQLKTLVGIEVHVKGTSNLANFVELRKAIHIIPGVKGIHAREMTADEAIIVVDFEGNERLLADALMVNTFSSFGINIYETAPNLLRIAFISE